MIQFAPWDMQVGPSGLLIDRFGTATGYHVGAEGVIFDPFGANTGYQIRGNTLLDPFGVSAGSLSSDGCITPSMHGLG